MVETSGAVPVERLRAALRLISPDHITPMGRRMLERIIEEYEQPKRARNDKK